MLLFVVERHIDWLSIAVLSHQTEEKVVLPLRMGLIKPLKLLLHPFFFRKVDPTSDGSLRNEMMTVPVRYVLPIISAVMKTDFPCRLQDSYRSRQEVQVGLLSEPLSQARSASDIYQKNLSGVAAVAETKNLDALYMVAYPNRLDLSHPEDISLSRFLEIVVDFAPIQRYILFLRQYQLDCRRCYLISSGFLLLSFLYCVLLSSSSFHLPLLFVVVLEPFATLSELEVGQNFHSLIYVFDQLRSGTVDHPAG